MRRGIEIALTAAIVVGGIAVEKIYLEPVLNTVLRPAPTGTEKPNNFQSATQKIAAPENIQTNNCFSFKTFGEKLKNPNDILGKPVCIAVNSQALISSYLSTERITYTGSGSQTVSVSITNDEGSVTLFTSPEADLKFPPDFTLYPGQKVDATVVMAKASDNDSAPAFPVAIVKGFPTSQTK